MLLESGDVAAWECFSCLHCVVMFVLLFVICFVLVDKCLSMSLLSAMLLESGEVEAWQCLNCL